MTTRSTAPMTRAASVGSIDAAKRTVDLTWTTGARVLRSSWFDGPFYEELSLDPGAVRMGRLQSGTAPFLGNHDGSDVAGVLGVVQSARIDGAQGTATVRFAAEGIDPVADQVFRKIQDGIVRNVSVGYRTYKTQKIEGVDNKIPTMRAIDWEPYELSAVAMGADAGAGFRSEGEEPNEIEILNRSTTQENNVSEQTDPKPPTEVTRAAPSTDDIARAVQSERERISGIRSACRVAKLDDAFAEKLVSEGTSLGDARAAVLDALATRQDKTPTEGHIVEVGEDDRDKFIRGASAWLIEKSGRSEVATAKARALKGDLRLNETRTNEFRETDLDGGKFRGMSLLDLARESLERRGISTRHMSRERLIDEALMRRDGGGYAPASDFAVLYENVMNKVLLGAYALAEDTWPKFCKVDTVPDFRDSNRFRVGSFGEMPIVPEGAEYTNAALPDGQKTVINTETRGRIIGLSRQAIINDDMGANADLAARFGRGFSLTLEIAVYALLAQNAGLGPTMSDTNPFFDAARSNINATGSALSVAGLDADRVQLLKQKDISSNEFLSLRPSILLVPASLGSAARRLNTAEFDTDGTALMQPNVVRGLFREVVDSPRLSGTRRYMFTDPGVSAAIVVAFLEGSGQAPMLEQRLGWRTDGLEWKARLDAKAQIFDPKAAVTNAGV